MIYVKIGLGTGYFKELEVHILLMKFNEGEFFLMKCFD